MTDLPKPGDPAPPSFAEEETRARLTAIVESSDDAIVSKDLNGIVASWNRAAERLFGYAASEAIGQSITIILPPDRLDEEPVILERVRRGERIDHFETVRRRKDGTLVDISLTVSPVATPAVASWARRRSPGTSPNGGAPRNSSSSGPRSSRRW